MKSLYAILTVAKYESIVLLRSWFFRILSLLTLILLVLLNYVLFTWKGLPGWFNGMSSFIPYLDLSLLNVAQAVVGVFGASEFLKDDRRLDVTEVIYPHSMTNAEYVFGKLLGLTGVFGGLNLIVLSVGLAFNLFFSDLPVVIGPYFWYPFLLSLPTLVFIIGLTFLLMALIGNQAITFIVLLGYIVATFYHLLVVKSASLFDFMGFNLPLTYSDFVGFGDLSRTLVQRGIYFLLGLGFTLLTVCLLRRLPQSRLMTRVSPLLAAASIAGALLLGQNFIKGKSEDVSLREKMRELNSQVVKNPMISLRRCDLEVIHAGKRIEATAHLGFTNKTAQPLDRYIFSLNPGLEVSAVTRNGAGMPFERSLHLITVNPPNALAPGAEDSLAVSYRGAIDERACYPDIKEDARKNPYSMLFYYIDKRFAFITPDYVLLTPEALWYPRAGLSGGAAYPEVLPEDFIDFSLRVKTGAGLTVVSQGNAVDKGAGEFTFKPETPLTQLSLAIGRYKLRSVTVEDSTAPGDSTTAAKIDYNLYYLEGHDFFSQYFTGLDSSLPGLIRSTRAQYEYKLGLKYPYRRLVLVETPVQFYAYPRSWTLGAETVQPELVLLPEKGVTMQSVNFRAMSYYYERAGQRGGSRMSKEESRRNMFQQFVNSTFLTSSLQGRAQRALSFDNGALHTEIDCSLVPLYHSYVRHYSSAEWPLFNLALEVYLNRRITTEQEDMTSVQTRVLRGMTPDDQANQALEKRSLAEIMASPGKDEDVFAIMKVKCNYLFNYIKCKVGAEELGAIIKNYLESQTFSDRNAGDFIAELSKRSGDDLGQFMNAWLHEKKLPAFQFTAPKMYEIIDGSRTRHQILCTVTNESDTDGLIGVNFRWGTGGNFERIWGGRPQNPADERPYIVKAGQTKEIGIVLNEAIAALWFNTYVSQNLPNSMEIPFSSVKFDRATAPFEGERVLDQAPVTAGAETIIVDNEDPGFTVVSSRPPSFLKRLLSRPDNGPKKYVGLLQGAFSGSWSNSLHGSFYGRYKHSGSFIKAGKGDKKVSWKADLSRQGKYELSYHIAELPPIMGMWRPMGGAQTPIVKDFNFTVHDDDGAKELKVDLDKVEAGWYSLGTFFFSKGDATVELTDQSKGKIVYADALRWTILN